MTAIVPLDYYLMILFYKSGIKWGYPVIRPPEGFWVYDIALFKPGHILNSKSRYNFLDNLIRYKAQMRKQDILSQMKNLSQKPISLAVCADRYKACSVVRSFAFYHHLVKLQNYHWQQSGIGDMFYVHEPRVIHHPEHRINK